jgi:hypothetical protein
VPYNLFLNTVRDGLNRYQGFPNWLIHDERMILRKKRNGALVDYPGYL